jgi:hypothetical protein
MANVTFYPEVKIPESEIIEYVSEGDPEYIKRFIMKIISDKYNKSVDEYCALLLMGEMTSKLAKQFKYEDPDKSKKYKELNELINELYG